MRLTAPLSVGFAVVLVAYACGGGPPPAPPPPPINQDSIDAANRAREDSLARERARADSIRRAREAEEAERRRLAEERRETERVRAMLEAVINFDYDKSDIRAGDARTLDQKLSILQANPSLRIQVAGHCDERGSDEYNIALGNRRALAAKQYLVDRGIAESRITTTSFGEERPVDAGSNEEAWARNRRDEFSITAGGDRLRAPSGM